MELLPVSKDYDQVSEHVRTFSANALYEMIAGLRPYVSEALSDPGGIHDVEPSRLVAYTQLLKLQSSLIKDLGLLYRVQDRPMPEGEEQIPASAVARILAEAQAAAAAELEAAVAATEARIRADVETRTRLSLEAAKEQVLGAAAALRRR
jgi:hypothetical protein